MKSMWISRRHSMQRAVQAWCRRLEVLSALLAAMITILSLFPSAARGAPEWAAMQSPIHYWHTNGNRIVDANGHPVRIAAVNWFGMENLYFLPAGLDRQPLDAILSRVRKLGFNTIRLPFSNQVVEANPAVTGQLNANASLQGLHALDILDRIVAATGRQSLRIILDNGRSDAGTYPQENGLWYTKRYPERSWISDWVRLAKRYKGNPTVVGVDLRDEPHTAPPGPWSLVPGPWSLKAYLHQSATWGPYRGMENKATDWRWAAERAGNAVLAVNPHLLIIVEGFQLYPDPTQPRGVDSYWWGAS
jgi:endoglucanase